MQTHMQQQAAKQHKQVVVIVDRIQDRTGLLLQAGAQHCNGRTVDSRQEDDTFYKGTLLGNKSGESN
jgi:hypothetical protein